MSYTSDIQSVMRTVGSVYNMRADYYFVTLCFQENSYLFTKTNSNTVISELISDDDLNLTKKSNKCPVKFFRRSKNSAGIV